MNLEALLSTWAAKYEVESVAERIVGERASACDALLARGVRVTVARDDSPVETSGVDLVVVHGDEGEDGVGEWRGWLTAMAKRASKLVVVETANPRALRHRARSLLLHLTGGVNGASGWGSTSILAPVLWELGRVREHAFLGAPDGLTAKQAERAAPRHAFVIDVTPRTPQARRRLRVAT